MRTALVIFSFFIFQVSYACLNLTGKISGSCVYSSPSFGDLNGFIEFDINQPSCEQMTIDGSTLKIPGEVEIHSKEQEAVNYTKLAMAWPDSKQEVLNFNYIYTSDINGKRVDDVNLKGFFKKEGRKIILQQTGVVDHDPVKISCELF